jgi:hypothetical protein
MLTALPYFFLSSGPSRFEEALLYSILLCVETTHNLIIQSSPIQAMCSCFRREDRGTEPSAENEESIGANLAIRPVNIATSLPNRGPFPPQNLIQDKTLPSSRQPVTVSLAVRNQSPRIPPKNDSASLNNSTRNTRSKDRLPNEDDPQSDQHSDLCELCQEIDWDQMANNGGYGHHEDIKDLKLEAEKKDGCPLCRLMWASLLHDNTETSLLGHKINLHVYPQDNPFTRWGDHKDALITDIYVSCVEKNSTKYWNMRGRVWTNGSHIEVSVGRG